MLELLHETSMGHLEKRERNLREKAEIIRRVCEYRLLILICFHHQVCEAPLIILIVEENVNQEFESSLWIMS